MLEIIKTTGVLAAGMPQKSEAQPPRLDALEALWEGKASEPQILLSAGKSAFSPAASASTGSKMVGVPTPAQHNLYF